jgi:hypothetical protein
MGTLETRYAERLGQFRARLETARAQQAAAVRGSEARARADAEIARLTDEETAYVLQSMPFIREYASEAAAVDEAPAGPLANFVAVTHKSNRNNVLQRYLMHVERQVDQTTLAAQTVHEETSKRHLREAEYFCKLCDAGMDFHARESMLVCPACGACSTFTEMSANNLTYEQEIHQDVVTYFAYKRLNHFCEWLNSLQAKENTEIPQGVIDAVKAEFKKTRTTTRADIKPAKVREFLKKLKLNKYYEHTNAICNTLNGVPAPKLTPALEEKLKAMFAEIQEPFERNCPPNRKNFLSYGYTLYKLCELLGEDDLLRRARMWGSIGRAAAAGSPNARSTVCHDPNWGRSGGAPPLPARVNTRTLSFFLRPAGTSRCSRATRSCTARTRSGRKSAPTCDGSSSRRCEIRPIRPVGVVISRRMRPWSRPSLGRATRP